MLNEPPYQIRLEIMISNIRRFVLVCVSSQLQSYLFVDLVFKLKNQK